MLVQDTAWPGYEDVPAWIVAGYETLFAELDAQLLEAGVAAPALVSVPAGVGSLAQAAVAHYRRPALPAAARPRLLSAEPDTAACVLASLAAGALVSVPTAATVMNGLNCGTVSSLAWPYIRGGMDAAIAVDDDAAAAAVAALAVAGVAAGPSGAAALAALRAALTGAGAPSRRRALGLDGDAGPAAVVCLCTEGPLAGCNQPRLAAAPSPKSNAAFRADRLPPASPMAPGRPRGTRAARELLPRVVKWPPPTR